MTHDATAIAADDITLLKVTREEDLPEWATRDQLEEFLFVHMKPYNDEPKDITKALDYAFQKNGEAGGYIMLAQLNGALAGACVMLSTGMGGFIPETVLLYIGVNSDLRGKGIGGKLMKASIDESEGDVKLHVEYDNPARHLYERFGFTSKYAEMRYKR